MRMRHPRRWLFTIAAVGLLGYLYNPPWIGGITSGMRSWENDRAGIRFRWTGGRASFYVPSDAGWVDIPLRAPQVLADRRPLTVDLAVDGRPVDRVTLADGNWLVVKMPVPPSKSWRRFRRIDMRVSRTVPNRNLGVQVGEVTLRRSRS